MLMRDAHYPGLAPIEAYGNGGFRFAGMRSSGSLLFLPSGVYAWDVASPADFTKAAFARVIEERAEIEILLIGTGVEIHPLLPELRDLFRGVAVDAMTTGAAVRTLNVLLSEDRAVAAALIAVD